MYKDHYDEIYQIPHEERIKFIDDVCALAETIKELFGADKINYGIYGDEVTHLHFTICPKYRDKVGFGGPFIMFPENPVYLTEKENSLLRECVEKRGVK